MQVIFCSRTHSQLTQFVSELSRTPFAATLSMVALASRKVRELPAVSPVSIAVVDTRYYLTCLVTVINCRIHTLKELSCIWVSCVAQTLCINPDVRALDSAPRINEACTDLQQRPATKKASKVTSLGPGGKEKANVIPLHQEYSFNLPEY